MADLIAEYYRCPQRFTRFASKGPLSAQSGYFQFGEGVTCYGKCRGNQPAESPEDQRHDSWGDIEIKDGTTYLPFNPSDVISNLRCEMYVNDWQRVGQQSMLAKMYYFIRPILPVSIRRKLQKVYLSGWDKVPFPRWPVDTSVDNLLQQLLLLAIRSSGVERIPFVWFWPEGAPSSAIMTHDVETTFGQEFCNVLMDIDDSFGMKASFQVVPEERYVVSADFIASIRDRDFEVVVHDLNHDGNLYRDHKRFVERATRINAYGRKYGAEGFRAAVLYRNQRWYDALEFTYDMSVPNVAHLDPQHGGCCTVMPYFIGNIVELPVTTIQDCTLFNVLNEHSADLWKRQIELIMEKHGLMSFIVHPDYIVAPRERGVYEELLGHLARLREENGIWITLPGEVNRWWRQRAEMYLVENGDGWRIEGEGAERARIAYASEKEGKVVFTLENLSPAMHLPPKPVAISGQ